MQPMIASMPFVPIGAALRSGQLDLLTFLEEVWNRIDTLDPHICALVPEPNRRERLLTEAAALQNRFSESESRPPLYGSLLGGRQGYIFC
jgi:Asp-tRNA(Asn)/Glu-tRNA(Gln) amidotransferase A subunit family amidase